MADQLLYTPFFYFPCYFVAAAVMRGRTLRSALKSRAGPRLNRREREGGRAKICVLKQRFEFSTFSIICVQRIVISYSYFVHIYTVHVPLPPILVATPTPRPCRALKSQNPNRAQVPHAQPALEVVRA